MALASTVRSRMEKLVSSLLSSRRLRATKRSVMMPSRSQSALVKKMSHFDTSFHLYSHVAFSIMSRALRLPSNG